MSRRAAWALVLRADRPLLAGGLAAPRSERSSSRSRPLGFDGGAPLPGFDCACRSRRRPAITRPPSTSRWTSNALTSPHASATTASRPYRTQPLPVTMSITRWPLRKRDFRATVSTKIPPTAMPMIHAISRTGNDRILPPVPGGGGALCTGAGLFETGSAEVCCADGAAARTAGSRGTSGTRTVASALAADGSLRAPVLAAAGGRNAAGILSIWPHSAHRNASDSGRDETWCLCPHDGHWSPAAIRPSRRRGRRCWRSRTHRGLQPPARRRSTPRRRRSRRGGRRRRRQP